MRSIIMLKNVSPLEESKFNALKANTNITVNIMLFKDHIYPIVGELDDIYYCKVMGKKFGIDKSLEGEVYTVIE